MSFVEQERALLDLLFDERLRRDFVVRRSEALAAYDLSSEERRDFASVRVDALEIDARMRVDLIMQRMCGAYPVSISISSSLLGGLDRVRSLIDASYVRSHPTERAGELGRGLRAFFVQTQFATPLEQAAAVAVCDAERSMALTASSLRKAMLSGKPAPVAAERAQAWEDEPLMLAPYVGITMLPQAYTAIKRALCPVSDGDLWTRLCATPLPAARRSQTLGHESPRLLVSRAHAKESSRCETTIDQRMLELSPGFAPLLSHLNGKTSVSDLLRELKRAGAADRVCQGVRAGFVELLSHGMVTTVLPT